MKYNLIVMEGHIRQIFENYIQIIHLSTDFDKKKNVNACILMYEFKVQGNLSTLTYGLTMDNFCPCFQEKLGKGTQKSLLYK